jgi:hypothetical protein
MPLVESRISCLTLLSWNVRWKMEVVVVNPFDLESWWELIVIFGHFPPAQDVNLRLYWYCRPIRKTIVVDSIVGRQEGISTVGKATCSLIWIESPGEIILSLRTQHLRLFFEDEEFMLVESGMNDLTIITSDVVQVNTMHSGTEINIALRAVVHGSDSDILDN